jgi:hypothetical protein
VYLLLGRDVWFRSAALRARAPVHLARGEHVAAGERDLVRRRAVRLSRAVRNGTWLIAAVIAESSAAAASALPPATPASASRSANGPRRSRRVPVRPWAITINGTVPSGPAPPGAYSHAAQESDPETNGSSLRCMYVERRGSDGREVRCQSTDVRGACPHQRHDATGGVVAVRRSLRARVTALGGRFPRRGARDRRPRLAT